MNQKFNVRFILALGISFTLISCNNDGKEESKTTDSTGTTKTETEQPVNQETVMDAIKASPDLYKVLSDTMGIRIVEATYKPGDSSALHSHADYAIYALSGGTATFYGQDGKSIENEMKTGTFDVRAAESHSVKNTGKTTLKVILVEVSRPTTATSQDASLDATKVASTLYKVKKDTLGLRVLDINYKPGQSSAMHSHPDVAFYVIQGGTTEFTAKDGTKRTMDLSSGMGVVLPADAHSVKNTGKTTVKAILVEVSRAAK